jgi:hypothetical protein
MSAVHVQGGPEECYSRPQSYLPAAGQRNRHTAHFGRCVPWARLRLSPLLPRPAPSVRPRVPSLFAPDSRREPICLPVSRLPPPIAASAVELRPIPLPRGGGECVPPRTLPRLDPIAPAPRLPAAPPPRRVPACPLPEAHLEGGFHRRGAIPRGSRWPGRASTPPFLELHPAQFAPAPPSTLDAARHVPPPLPLPLPVAVPLGHLLCSCCCRRVSDVRALSVA